MGEALTVIEQDNLVELEETIQKNLKAFYEVGFALMQIRDNRLYRAEYGTFEQYCKERWGFERRHAYRLIDGYKVVESVSHGTQKGPKMIDVDGNEIRGNTIIIRPKERAIRPLAKIKDPEEQREIYQRAVETAPNGKVTAEHIEQTIREVRGEVEKPPEVDEDSNNLFHLKRFWKLCTKKDKKIFLKWIKEDN